MKFPSRMALLGSFASLALAGAGLVGCGAITTTNGVTTISTTVLASDAQNIVNGLTVISGTAAVQNAVGSTNAATIANDLTSASGVVKQISEAPATITVPTGQSWVTTLATDTESTASILAGTSGLPSSVTDIAEAIQVIIPGMQGVVGLFAAPAPSGNTMTLAHARQILAAAK